MVVTEDHNDQWKIKIVLCHLLMEQWATNKKKMGRKYTNNKLY